MAKPSILSQKPSVGGEASLARKRRYPSQPNLINPLQKATGRQQNLEVILQYWCGSYDPYGLAIVRWRQLMTTLHYGIHTQMIHSPSAKAPADAKPASCRQSATSPVLGSTNNDAAELLVVLPPLFLPLSPLLSLVIVVVVAIFLLPSQQIHQHLN
jgi:hypothetical protein